MRGVAIDGRDSIERGVLREADLDVTPVRLRPRVADARVKLARPKSGVQV